MSKEKMEEVILREWNKYQNDKQFRKEYFKLAVIDSDRYH